MGIQALMAQFTTLNVEQAFGEPRAIVHLHLLILASPLMQMCCIANVFYSKKKGKVSFSD